MHHTQGIIEVKESKWSLSTLDELECTVTLIKSNTIFYVYIFMISCFYYKGIVCMEWNVKDCMIGRNKKQEYNYTEKAK